MIFKASTERLLAILYLFMGCLLLVGGLDSLFIIITSSFAVALSLIMLFTTYEFEIKEEVLHYNTYVFGYRVYQKTAAPSDIEKIVMKRVNWKTRLAIVKLKKSWSMRIALFQPANVFEEIEAFADRHGVQVQKTADYRLLEKMK